MARRQTYKQMVSEARRIGRRLKKESEPDQWRRAELCWQAVDDDDGPKMSARQWAEDIDMGFQAVNRHRRTWKKYSDKQLAQPFADAYLLANSSAEQAAALTEVAARHDSTVQGARGHQAEVRSLRDQLRADPDVTDEVLADPELVRRALRNPIVNDAIASDGESLTSLMETRATQHRSGRARSEPAVHKRDSLTNWSDAIGLIGRSERALRDALQVLIDSDVELNDDVRDSLSQSVERVERRASGLRAWLHSGGVTDEALADLLQGE